MINKKSQQSRSDNKQKKEDKMFKKEIENIFKFSGFISLPVENKEFKIANRKHELDHCFVSENIIIICEQTISKNKDSNHMIKKEETARIITQEYKNDFLDILDKRFEKNFKKEKFKTNRWKIFYLYFSKNANKFSIEDKKRYSNLILVDKKTYNYFVKMSKCIKNSFRYEIMRFLKIQKEDYGEITSSISSSSHPVSIIYPDDVTGLDNGVGIVSFMMSPEELIKTSYVLRKDSWGEDIGLYQRLITEARLKDIRKFVIHNKRTFYNNIIVGLPSSTKIYKDNIEISVNDLSKYENCKISIIQDFNSISIIDGQHRVYAYYENNIKNDSEKEISKLRNKLNLLVTGLLFPKDWSEEKKQRFQSEIFLQINNNKKSIDKDVLLHIESIIDPLSSNSIARLVLKKLNEKDPFKNKFELSLVEEAQIKVSSIIQFALSSLVSGNKNSQGFYKYWKPKSSKKPESLNTELLEEYVDYCSTQLQQYFKAIKENYETEWSDFESYLLKVTSVNGFIIALNESLKLTNGPKGFEFYRELFSLEKIDFSKEKFPYSSGSKYKQFATKMLLPLFYKRYEGDM